MSIRDRAHAALTPAACSATPFRGGRAGGEGIGARKPLTRGRFLPLMGVKFRRVRDPLCRSSQKRPRRPSENGSRDDTVHVNVDGGVPGRNSDDSSPERPP